MKGWAHYDELRLRLEAAGLRVNVLPQRTSLLEHMGDVSNHRCLVSGDSLPMHLALGTATPCVTLFNCTSPWEIHEYGIQTKIVSPLLEKFFYKRGLDPAATSAIGLDEVYESVMERLA
jgi:ADP-heptose:LPS heptosyltransferase